MHASTSSASLGSSTLALQRLHTHALQPPRLPTPSAACAGRHHRRCCLGAPLAGATRRDSAGASAGPFAEGAQRLASDASQRLNQFVKEHQLEEKAAAAGQAASQRLSEGWQEAQESWRRTSLKLDSEWGVGSKARRAARQARQAATDVDQRWGVSRTLRRAAAGAAAQLPVWRRRVGEAAGSPGGRAALLLVALLVLSSGLVWQLLHLAWMMWVVSVPLGLYAANQARQGGVRRSGGGAGGAGGGGGGGGGAAPRAGGAAWGGSGPVIDAEFKEVSR